MCKITRQTGNPRASLLGAAAVSYLPLVKRCVWQYAEQAPLLGTLALSQMSIIKCGSRRRKAAVFNDLAINKPENESIKCAT